jgi:YebC/PmpR family DNA-binding regulatory protein
MVTIAARQGGDPGMNFRLRLAIDTARAANMPKDRIEKAVKRGTGELKDGALFEELVYEAYGPGQVALLIGTATDNRNRTFGEVRAILTKNGGKIVPEGSVAYLFRPVGEISCSLEGKDRDEAELSAIESGADDVELDAETLYVYTLPEDLQSVQEALQKKGFAVLTAGLSHLPLQKTSASLETIAELERLLELLEEHQDVQTVWDNLS